MFYQTDQQFFRVSQLVDGGDWACAYAQCGTLIHICLQLAEIIDDPELVERARVVASEAGRDLGSATRQWSELSSALRHAPMAPGAPVHRAEHGARL